MSKVDDDQDRAERRQGYMLLGAVVTGFTFVAMAFGAVARIGATVADAFRERDD